MAPTPDPQPPAPIKTAILLIAHGSRHAPANDDLHDLAARLAARGDDPIVEAAFLELAEPDIPTGGDRCVSRGAERVLMVPYFLAEGVHLRRDLAAARDALARRHPGVEFRLAAPLGPHPLLDRLVEERIRQVEQREPIVAPGVDPSPPPTPRGRGEGERHSADGSDPLAPVFGGEG